MPAFIRVACVVFLIVAAACGQSADAATVEVEPKTPPAAAELTVPKPTPEPSQPPSEPEPANDTATAPAATPTGMCQHLDRWRLSKRYALTDCKSALKEGCDETLGMMVASVERSLETDPERLRSAGATMADLLAEMGSQVDKTVLKPADAVLAEIKAYAPTETEKQVHATLVADHEAFIVIAKRWSKALHKYKGDVMALADLQTETEKAETKALVSEVKFRAMCNGASK